MNLILPLIGMFVFVGLTQTKMTRRVYIPMILVILVALLYFYFSWLPMLEPLRLRTS